MQAISKTLFLFLAILLILPDAHADEQIFFGGTYEQLRQEAEKQGKPYFIYFYAQPGKLDRETFGNKYVKMYVKSRYLAFKSQAFSLYSDFLTRKYEVKKLPQICIFTPQGKMVERIEGFISAKDLLDKLRTHERKQGKPADNNIAFGQAANPELSLQLRELAEIKEVYKFSIRRQTIKEKTIAVQLGVFESYDNLVKSVQELDENWHDNIMVVEVEIEKRRLFRLMLGPFYTIEHAKGYQRSLRERKGLYGLIIALDDFQPIAPEREAEYSVERFQKPKN
ncbi:MAG: SPOR domain-containing protein [Bernardetiaceae bacterium]|nr:SPOR domain-containing protein [Bernardetiaceae bacterium]